jgi:ubiquinone/menaquinone biosynthesis C-methylase UbiE
MEAKSTAPEQIKNSYHDTHRAWNNVAELYQTWFMDLDLYDDTYDAFCNRLEKPGARILEIGCGPGNITRYLLRKRPDFDLLATDVAPNMVELAQKNNPAARCEVLDCRNLNRLDTRFDGIVCGFCLPYLSKDDCAQLLRECSRLLHPGGVLYLSAIEGDYARSGYETGRSTENTMFVYYYEADFLMGQLLSNGFGGVETIRKPYTKSDGTASTHLIFIAVNNRL